MLPNIGDKLLRQLTSRIELSQVPDNRTPDHFSASLDLGGSRMDRNRRRGQVRITWGGVEVERVLEGGDGLGDVSAQPLKTIVHGRWCFDFGRSRGGRGLLGSVVGPHQNLLHQVVVGGGSAGPALKGCSHGRRPECLLNGNGNVV